MRIVRASRIATAVALAVAAAVATSPAMATGSGPTGNTAGALTLKAPVTGLMARSANAAPSPYLSGVDVNANWADLEPTPGTFTFGAIDAGLAKAAANGYAATLRIFAGDEAPEWAKQIGGAPMPFYDHTRRVVTTIGRFWTPAYQAAWQQLMTAVASRYDNNQTLREVHVGGTGVESTEVCLLMAADKIPGQIRTNGSYWLAAGYTEAARQAALTADIAFMARTWHTTRIDLTVHPMEQLAANGTDSTSLTATEDLITATATADGQQVIFGHTGLAQSLIDGTAFQSAKAMYDFILGHHYLFNIQTQALSNPDAGGAGMGNPAVVLGWARANGLLSVELPGGWQSFPTTVLASVNQAMHSQVIR